MKNSNNSDSLNYSSDYSSSNNNITNEKITPTESSEFFEKDSIDDPRASTCQKEYLLRVYSRKVNPKTTISQWIDSVYVATQLSDNPTVISTLDKYKKTPDLAGVKHFQDAVKYSEYLKNK